VARDVRQTYVDDDLRDVYLPFAQAPSRYSPLFIRTDRSARFWVDGLSAAVAAIDPEVQVTGPKALQLEGDALLSQPKFLTSLLIGFGVFTTLLTLLGIYGVTAYTVSQREREIAIRMALGSSRQGVVQLFLRSGGVLLVAGIAVGLLGAIAVARLLESQLHGVTPFDVTTLVVACALLATTGLLAMWWPVRRATGKDPAANLRDA
jgi:ABC-type antimicrobial peptide transport system permease subunit